MNGHVNADPSNSSEEESEFSDAESEEEIQSQEDPMVAAEQAKEAGNVQFKEQRYGNAIDLYTKAHGECLVSDLSGPAGLLIGTRIRRTPLAWMRLFSRNLQN